MSMTPLKQGRQTGMCISAAIWRALERHAARRTFIWCATTLCQCSTGPGPALARLRPDGSTVLAYTQEAVDRLDPETMFSSIAGDMNGTVLPGWEPERMARVKELFAMYRDVDEERLFENLRYFLERYHARMPEI